MPELPEVSNNARYRALSGWATVYLDSSQSIIFKVADPT